MNGNNAPSQWTCPVDGSPLIEQVLADLNDGFELADAEPTDRVLVNQAQSIVYRFEGPVPVLLPNEGMRASATVETTDVPNLGSELLSDDMDFYGQWSAEAIESEEFQDDLNFLTNLRGLEDSADFPTPAYRWLRPSPAIGGELRMLQQVAPVTGASCLQIGGRGVEGIALALAGASSVTVVSPIIGELQYGMQLARELGVLEQMSFGCGIAERLPVPSAGLDRVISRHCLHHTVLSDALREVERVLAPHGRFGSVDVWRAPMYDFGIKHFGKATPGVNCEPLDDARLAEVSLSELRIEEGSHGALLRYPLAVVQRMGVLLPGRVSLGLARAEDFVARLAPVARHRSLITLNGIKAGGRG